MHDPTGNTPFDTLKLSDLQKHNFVDKLETIDEADEERDRRRSDRTRVREDLHVVISYDDKIERDVWFKAVPRNLSDHGMAVLHGAFIYPNSKAMIRFELPGGQKLSIMGTIRRCNFISGKTHDVGVEFDKPIDASIFYEPGAADEAA
jgi:hypothetical protein